MARLLLPALLPILSYAIPTTTTTIAVASGCHRNDCLREFIRSTSAASSFCHSYTITPSPVTSTVVASTPLTATSTLGSAPSKQAEAQDPQRRELVSLAMNLPAITAAPTKRAAATFPSICAAATTRTASACSCLGMPLTTATPATIYTTTYPSTTTIPACNDA
ncbi:hypothetical protein MMC30_003536 [Trapelia coarctata]|nr:hypothetical protein [Trapelia coarctata]